MQVRRKLEKSRFTVFFQWFVALEGRQACSLKRRVGSHLARWEMKNCTPLWREACRSRNVESATFSEHFWKLRCRKSARCCGAKHNSKPKGINTHHAQTTFGSWDIEKVHAVVARSTFRSQNGQSTPCSEHFWKLRCRKSARRCGAKHIARSKCRKHLSFGALLWNWAVEKVYVIVARSTFPSQNVKAPHARTRFRFAWRGQGIVHLVKRWAKREGFVAFPKPMAGVGHLKRICKNAFSVAGAVQETCSPEMLGGPGADVLRGVAFWSIRSSVLGRWICVTGAALRRTWHLFSVAGAALCTDGVKKTQNALVRGCQLCTQLSIFERSLAQLQFLRFWCCQLRKLRKSRRIASFLTLSSSKIQEVSENSCVFDVAKVKNSGSLAD